MCKNLVSEFRTNVMGVQKLKEGVGYLSFMYVYKSKISEHVR